MSLSSSNHLHQKLLWKGFLLTETCRSKDRTEPWGFTWMYAVMSNFKCSFLSHHGSFRLGKVSLSSGPIHWCVGGVVSFRSQSIQETSHFLFIMLINFFGGTHLDLVYAINSSDPQDKFLFDFTVSYLFIGGLDRSSLSQNRKSTLQSNKERSSD